MFDRILPPEDAPENGKNWPLSLVWDSGEYDVYLRNGQPPDDETLLQLRTELNKGSEDSAFKWGVLERGEGRINLLPPMSTPRHEHVAAVVTRLFAQDFLD